MNKFAAAAATAALMLSLSAGALAASGLGSVTNMSGSEAAADKAGSATVNTTMCALELDDAGKITAVSFDIAQNKIGFDAAGALTSELTGEHPTKKELGDGYGMRGASALGKEWYEHSAGYCSYLKGKTEKEVADIPADGSDADLAALCTISIDALQKAAGDAFENASL